MKKIFIIFLSLLVVFSLQANKEVQASTSILGIEVRTPRFQYIQDYNDDLQYLEFDVYTEDYAFAEEGPPWRS